MNTRSSLFSKRDLSGMENLLATEPRVGFSSLDNESLLQVTRKMNIERFQRPDYAEYDAKLTTRWFLVMTKNARLPFMAFSRRQNLRASNVREGH